MAPRSQPLRRTHLAAPRPPFERIVLALQGGGAMGAYQGGVYQALADEACAKLFNIVHLIYRARGYEGDARDYEFSRPTMQEHWQAGYNDAVRTLRYPEVLQRHEGGEGVFTFDVEEQGRD